MINKFQNSGIIKRAAHAINEHGNKPIYQDGFDAWYSSLTGNNLALLRSEATMAYEKENRPLYPEGASLWEMLKPEYSQKALRWWYDTKIHPSRRDAEEKRANTTHSQNAAAISLAGSAVGMAPHIYTKIAGAALTIPDQIYDWAEAIDEPKNSNTAHVVLDYPELLGKIIPGKVDDIVLKAGNLVSNADDLASTGGSNIFSFLDGPENKLAIQYDRSKPQVSSTYVRKPISSIVKRVDRYQTGGNIRGRYLDKAYRDYYSYFKSYDDFINSQSYKDITDPKQKTVAKNMAKYYYNTNPELNDFWKLAYYTIPEYRKRKAQYKNNNQYVIDMGDPNYRLKSLDANGKPTNKHTLKMHQNVLDYIYNEAVRGGVDPKTAISIATQESNLGVDRQSNSKVNAFDLFSYWNGIGDNMYTNSQTSDLYNDLYNKITSEQQLSQNDLRNIQLLKERYNKLSNNIHEYNGTNVVADAVKMFNTGKYNLGDPNYIDTVNSRFSELMNDDRFANWWNSKPQLKFGGIIKRK